MAATPTDPRLLSHRLREVEQALRDMPPHSASGTRQRLEDERARLQRAMAETRRR